MRAEPGASNRMQSHCREAKTPDVEWADNRFVFTRNLSGLGHMLAWGGGVRVSGWVVVMGGVCVGGGEGNSTMFRCGFRWKSWSACWAIVSVMGLCVGEAGCSGRALRASPRIAVRGIGLSSEVGRGHPGNAAASLGKGSALSSERKKLFLRGSVPRRSDVKDTRRLKKN